MPKKTKKQKIIAEYRKRIKLIKESAATSNLLHVENQIKTITNNQEKLIQTSEKKSSLIDSNIQILDQNNKVYEKEKSELLLIKKYFLQDFRKSFSLIFLIIVLEIIFYFVNIKNY